MTEAAETEPTVNDLIQRLEDVVRNGDEDWTPVHDGLVDTIYALRAVTILHTACAEGEPCWQCSKTYPCPTVATIASALTDL